MSKIKEILIKYKSFILYIFFGGCTTLVNIVSYAVCSRSFQLETVPSTVVAWILAVAFAYVTNRIWVFESKANQVNEIVREIISFFSCRLLTGLLDLGIMYVSVDLWGWNDLVMKVLSNVLVIILNYIASKLVIFKQKSEENMEDRES